MDLEAEFQAARGRVNESIDVHVEIAKAAIAEVCVSLRPRAINVFLSRRRGQQRRRQREKLALAMQQGLANKLTEQESV